MARLLVGSSCVWASLAAPTKLKMGQDINYPPYAFKNETSGELEGFGIDVARGVQAVCSDELEFEFVETRWETCWSGANGGTIGASLNDGTLDACMTYTHTFGKREEFLDFSYGILVPSKPAGLLTRLVDGCPVVDGGSDLSGKTVVDVAGWAPTADGLDFVENKCTGKKYSSNYNLIAGAGEQPNDVALELLLNGTADAMFVYADQAKNYQCKGEESKTWNCSMWDGFGKTFAYVQTGQMGHAANSTTLAITKKGSGVEDLINPCLVKFMETKEYYDICKKHGFEGICYRNSFFPEDTKELEEWQKETDEHGGTCSIGYCPCTDAECGYEYTSGSTTVEDASGSTMASAMFVFMLLVFRLH